MKSWKWTYCAWCGKRFAKAEHRITVKLVRGSASADFHEKCLQKAKAEEEATRKSSKWRL